MSHDLVTAVDFGSSKILAVAGQVMENDSIEIIGYAERPLTSGMRRGMVNNLAKVGDVLSEVMDEINVMTGQKIRDINLVFGGEKIRSVTSHGVVAISHRDSKDIPVVTQQDVKRVLESAEDMMLPPDSEIVHSRPQKFQIDDQKDVTSPLGMSGNRLEVDVNIIAAPKNLITNLTRIAEAIGLRINHPIYAPLASAEAVLSVDEKDLGCVLVDIGADLTQFGVYHGGSLRHSGVIPIGGASFTRDVAIMLTTSMEEAERLKRESGTVSKKQVMESGNEVLRVSLSGHTHDREITEMELHDIIHARSEELLHRISLALSDAKVMELIRTGFVLTGGGSLLNGLVEMTQWYFGGTAVRIGSAKTNKNLRGAEEMMSHPGHVAALGALQFVDKSSKSDIEVTGSGYKRSLWRKIIDDFW